MKWTIHELKKKVYSDNEIDQVIDLKAFLSDDFVDLIDISSTSIKGYYEYIKAEDVYAFYLKVQTILTMLCSITLKEVKINLDFDTDLYFSETNDDDDIHLIEGITIDLNPYIFSEIITEKPMRVISPDADKEFHEEKDTIDETEVLENSPFAKLKK
ncbi:hypothetical protein HF295_00320 [Hujiaoplasma nucleasis]|uniref:DUF177 domain-containing protein n=1 Tax=Hujiaoplasma nucleasis TaxID=2725268 RepID=A0A7L6MZG9_9MOLU|nr:YceD family protein [Hujiaoplasma nucleasis]QLY39383.1 hypothetical protein HF295_00320 [Hujiaoplasma nucleasis]